MTSPTDQTPDWPQQFTEAIVAKVDDVKYKTTTPATKAARGLVYGIVILILGVPALIMILVGVVHFLNWVATEQLNLGVWLVYLVLGLIFTFGGWFLWRKRVA